MTDELENLHRVGLKATLPRMRVLEVIRASARRHLSAEDVCRRLIEESLALYGLCLQCRAKSRV